MNAQTRLRLTGEFSLQGFALLATEATAWVLSSRSRAHLQRSFGSSSALASFSAMACVLSPARWPTRRDAALLADHDLWLYRPDGRSACACLDTQLAGGGVPDHPGARRQGSTQSAS
jgi:hypothetical protein